MVEGAEYGRAVTEITVPHALAQMLISSMTRLLMLFSVQNEGEGAGRRDEAALSRDKAMLRRDAAAEASIVAATRARERRLGEVRLARVTLCRC